MPDMFLIKSLDKLFADNLNKRYFAITGKCHICNRAIEIEIVKTSGGYGFNGGILRSQNKGQVIIMCADCFDFTAIKKPPAGVRKTNSVYDFLKSRS